MGRKLNMHHEAWHFLDNNKKILDIAHADWDIPLVFESLLKAEITRDAVMEFLKNETSDQKMIRHFFGRNFAFKERFFPHDNPWGWKDPRTSITFPLWYEIYPEARFILLIRNGVDVANSLKRREDEKLTRIQSRATSTRCQSLEEAFRLWEEYNEFFSRYQQIIPEEKLLILRYEDLLTNSKENLLDIAKFLELQNPKEFISTASMRINPGNAYKFKADKNLIEFYHDVRTSSWMKDLGYSDLEGVKKIA